MRAVTAGVERAATDVCVREGDPTILEMIRSEAVGISEQGGIGWWAIMIRVLGMIWQSELRVVLGVF